MKNKVSEEELIKYASGKASVEEMAEVALAIKEDPTLKDLIEILERMNNNGCLCEDGILPAGDCAGASEDNLCDILCERFILQDYLGEKIFEVPEDENNFWLRESGTPLHSIGRMLEKYGMSVKRLYDCNADDIIRYLNEKKRVIAVVDSGQLWSGESDGLFHAVVCISISPGTIAVYDPAKYDKSLIKIYDPKAGSNMSYEFSRFLSAWKYSHNYLVVASSESLEYQPHPINIDNIVLDEDLLELTEAIAEDSHEVWALKRKNEGWTCGKHWSDTQKTNPDLVPYSELSECEKDYDRESALHTLRLVKRLGFEIHRRYTHYCPKCGEFVDEIMNFCPNCGNKLDGEGIR